MKCEQGEVMYEIKHNLILYLCKFIRFMRFGVMTAVKILILSFLLNHHVTFRWLPTYKSTWHLNREDQTTKKVTFVASA